MESHNRKEVAGRREYRGSTYEGNYICSYRFFLFLPKTLEKFSFPL